MELGVVLSPSIANPVVGDLELSDAGDEVVRTTLAAEVAQRLRVRLSFFRGEWFLNLNAGTPYYQLIFQKSPSDRVIRSVFSQVIKGTEGVAELTRFYYSVNRQREMALSFEARLKDGTLFKSTTFGAFVVIP